jgi:hypothetical protein
VRDVAIVSGENLEKAKAAVPSGFTLIATNINLYSDDDKNEVYLCYTSGGTRSTLTGMSLRPLAGDEVIDDAKARTSFIDEKTQPTSDVSYVYYSVFIPFLPIDIHLIGTSLIHLFLAVIRIDWQVTP